MKPAAVAVLAVPMLFAGRGIVDAAEQPTPATVPGVVIAHSPASSGLYIGSPSIAVLPNGEYVASHDFFGPKSAEGVKALTRVYASADRGKTWQQRSEIVGAFWSTLFVHREALYLLGTDKHHGNAVIRRSTDQGRTWTTPATVETGLLRDNGEYHCAPMPVVGHNGRLWRGMEWRSPPVGDGDLVFLSPEGRPLHGENLLGEFYLVLAEAGIPRVDRRGRTLDLHAARTTVYARGAAAGIPVDQMMTFVGHRDIRTAMRHYRDPDATSTQAIAARLAATAAVEQTTSSAPVAGAATRGAAPAAPAVREPPRNTPPSVRVGTARARGAEAAP